MKPHVLSSSIATEIFVESGLSFLGFLVLVMLLI
jgi:hypothetical protein